MPSSIKLVFWAALLLPVYSYLLYPIVVIAVAALVRLTISRQIEDKAEAAAPAVAIVVAAYNEEQHIAALIRSLSTLDYRGPYTLYIGSDGSTDHTASILASFAGQAIKVFPYPRNRGKASVLNDLVAETSENIIVFTDANTQFAADAVTQLVRRFADPQVGVVCGELKLRSVANRDNADSLYWRFERLLKTSESVLGALLGANGGIYAIRRECFRPILPDTVVDDFCIAMTAAVAGKELVYEPLARATEDAPTRLQDEFTRRIRIGIGNYQAFFRHPEYLFKAGLMRGIAYFSHKVVRWFTPHCLVVLLLANALLWSYPGYREFCVLQIMGYACCAALYFAKSRFVIPAPIRVPVFLTAMNVAFAVGFYRFVTGAYSGSWKRTRR